MARKKKSEAEKIKGALRVRPTRMEMAAGNEDVFFETVRRQVARKRRRIKKKAGGNSPNPALRVAARRFANDQAKKLRRKFMDRPSLIFPMEEALTKRVASRILDQLDPQRPSKWKPIIARKFRRDPKRIQIGSLNFLDHPIETIEEFQKLSRAERSEVRAYLDFADTHCFDVGAYLVLGEIWPQLSKVFLGGRMSRPVQKVLSAIRMDEELGIGLGGVRNHEDVWAFPVRRRRPYGTTSSETANLQPQDREKVADLLCELIDGWLEVANNEEKQENHPDWELSPEGKSLLARMSGELLDNAERHSVPGSKDGDWSMTAFMAARDDEESGRQLNCYLAFLNTGQSIAEAMKQAPKELLEAAEKYLSQFGRRGPSRDTLLTVIALQDAVTSDLSASEGRRGGTGLQDVLEFISELGAAYQPKANAKMTIISGSSCIRLKQPNLVGARDTRGKRVQWCNACNDPSSPPDPAMAFDLPKHFAGTLVSVGFTLDPRLFVAEVEQ
ncbi:MAG: hypothetical protein AAGB23_14255 [Pseudomonadota bacterium]